MISRLRAWLRWLFMGCDHDWIWLHDTPEKLAQYDQDYDEWFEDYPHTDFPKTYRCGKCGVRR